MCMARVNIYLPDDLAADAKAAGLNVSKVAQHALRAELSGRRTTAWLARVRRLPATSISHDEAMAALDAARDEDEDRFG